MNCFVITECAGFFQVTHFSFLKRSTIMTQTLSFILPFFLKLNPQLGNYVVQFALSTIPTTLLNDLPKSYKIRPSI